MIYSPEKRQNESYPQEDLYSKFTLQIFHTKCRTVLNDEIENHWLLIKNSGIKKTSK